MSFLDHALSSLGNLYMKTVIDGEPVIYRDLGNGYEFEVSGLSSDQKKNGSLYVWHTSSDRREIVGIYHRVPVSHLPDVLGHYAFMYRNLQEKIQVEREEMKQ